MSTAELAGQIVMLVDRQAEAIASNDFAQLETLTSETSRLIQALDAHVASLTPDERIQLAALIQPAADRAGALVETTGSQLAATRQEIQELHQGRSATNAYRQSVQQQPAISYSRAG